MRFDGIGFGLEIDSGIGIYDDGILENENGISLEHVCEEI
jgi:hypothetical protein